MPPLFVFLEIFRILKINKNGVLFDVTFFEHFLNDFFFGQRAFFGENAADDVLNHARHVAPFGESVETASNENKALVLDELVVSSGHVSLLIEILGNSLGHFFEMDRRTVLPNDEEGVVAHTLSIDVGRRGSAPLAERILANLVRNAKPSLDNLFVLVLFVQILNLFEERAYEVALDHELVVGKHGVKLL